MNTYLPGYLKTKNRTRVMELFLERREMTRPDIARLTGISMPTVIKIVDFLISKNIVTVNPEDMAVSDSGYGRKSQLLRLNTGACGTIGIYYEGNALRMGLVNMAFEVVEEKAFFLDFSSPLPGRDEELSSMIVEEMGKILDRHPETHILGAGFAFPGIVDGQTMGLRKSGKTPVFEAFDQHFPAFRSAGTIPLYIENDMNAASLGEMIQRKPFRGGNLLYLSLGTGFGSGIIIDGKIWHGANCFAGEVARIQIPCVTGEGLRYEKKRYVEEYICQRALEEKFGIDFRRPDSCSEEVRRKAVRYISSFLSLVIRDLSFLFDIADFVIAGLTAEYFGSLFFSILEEEIAGTEDPDRAGPEIHIMPSLNGREGIVGSAYIAFSNCLPKLLAEDPEKT